MVDGLVDVPVWVMFVRRSGSVSSEVMTADQVDVDADAAGRRESAHTQARGRVLGLPPPLASCHHVVERLLSEGFYKILEGRVSYATLMSMTLYADSGLVPDVIGERLDIMNGGPASALGADQLPVSVRPMSPYVRPPLAIAFARA